VVDVYPVGLHKPVDQETETDEKTGKKRGRHVCRCGRLVSKERHRMTTIVKTLFVEITAALIHVINYQDAERKRQVHGKV